MIRTRQPISALYVVVFLLSLAVPASAQVRAPGWFAGDPQPRSAYKPTKVIMTLQVDEAFALSSAEEGALDQLDAMQAWNESGQLPMRNGFVRRLPEPLVYEPRSTKSSTVQAMGGVVQSMDGTARIWATSIRVVGADRLRIQLVDVSLPESADLWVWGEGEEPVAFGAELIDPEGVLWTPSAGGERIYLELRIPAELAGSVKFRIEHVMEIFIADEMDESFAPVRNLNREMVSPSLGSEMWKGLQPFACDLPRVSCGNTLNRSITSDDCAGDDFYFDLYVINVSAGQTLTVTVTASGRPIIVAILDSEANELLAGGNGTGTAVVSYTSPSAQDLLVAMRFQVTFGTGSYQINFSCFSSPPPPADCIEDATCISSSTLDVIDQYRRSVARMQYVKGTDSFLCSGALVNGNDSSIRYFLTANHCLSTQASAASLEAFWDYRRSGCNGSIPGLSAVPRSNGSTILATSPVSDFTLLRLNSVPGQRFLLGWDARASMVTHGTTVHRISHPEGKPQAYSRATVTTLGQSCQALPRPNFIYASHDFGGTKAGSSGSPVILSGGFIVGQLYGDCGPNPEEDCDPRNSVVDGAFSTTFPFIRSFLEQSTCTACVENATTACVLNDRFTVEMRWRNQFDQPATEGTGRIIRYAENNPEVHPQLGPLSESVFFSMFPHAQSRVELVLKLFKGVGINDKYWVFVSSLTNNEYWVKVTDTQTCQTWERYNPHGSFSVITDFEAFPFP